jgi:general secretion pathway protein G
MVVTIAGTLLAIASSSFASVRQKAMIVQAKVDLSQMMQALERYRMRSPSSLPLTLAELGFANLRDPWGNPYVYLNFSQVRGKGAMRKDHNLVPINSEFDLYSMGPDGQSRPPLTAKASRDDIIVGNDGQFIGPACDY